MVRCGKQRVTTPKMWLAVAMVYICAVLQVVTALPQPSSQLPGALATPARQRREVREVREVRPITPHHPLESATLPTLHMPLLQRPADAAGTVVQAAQPQIVSQQVAAPANAQQEVHRKESHDEGPKLPAETSRKVDEAPELPGHAGKAMSLDAMFRRKSEAEEASKDHVRAFEPARKHGGDSLEASSDVAPKGRAPLSSSAGPSEAAGKKGRVVWKDSNQFCTFPDDEALPARMFNLKPTPRCSKKRVEGSFQDGKLTLSCPHGSYYVDGELKQYHEPVDIPSEMVFVKCRDTEGILVNVRKHGDTYDKAKAGSVSQSSSTGGQLRKEPFRNTVTGHASSEPELPPASATHGGSSGTGGGSEASKGSNDKPNILVLFVDAISHLHANRAFPKTLQFLEHIGDDASLQHRAFRFEIFQSIRKWTDPNYYALIAGQKLFFDSVDDRKPDFFPGYNDAEHKFKPPNDLSKVKFEPCPTCLWKSLVHEAGYVPGYVSECGISERTPAMLGSIERNPNKPFHHIATNAFRDAGFEDSGSDKCFGDRPGFASTFEYARQFFDVYHDVPKWLFVHSLVGHNEMDRFSTADEALAEVMRDILGKHPNTMVILMGDHGNRNFLKLKEKQRMWYELEFRNPLLELVFPKSLLQSHQGAEQALVENTRRLVTPFDLFTLQRTVALGTTHGVPPETPGVAANILSPLPSKRSCEDTGTKYSCQCNPDQTFFEYQFNGHAWEKVRESEDNLLLIQEGEYLEG